MIPIGLSRIMVQAGFACVATVAGSDATLTRT
jgi:hypothetical protein